MPYTLRALIARCEVFAEPPAWIADSAVIPLAQGFCMLPLSRELCYGFGPADRPWLYATHGVFIHLPDGLVPHLRELSRRGPLAYVESEYHGGDGEQRSMVWENGEPREPEESSRAIHDALISLGVQRAEGQDAFDTLGLGRHRSVDDWLAEAHAPASPETPVAPADAVPTAPQPPHEPRPWWRFW